MRIHLSASQRLPRPLLRPAPRFSAGFVRCPAHAHAVTALGDNKYEYDENGNMSVRWISGTRTMMAYDADTVPAGGNRVVGVTTCPDADGLGCDATETEIAQFTGVYPEPVEVPLKAFFTICYTSFHKTE